MKSNIVIISFAFLLTSCYGQKKLDATLIFDSRVKNDVSISIKKNDSNFFSKKYHWIVYKNLSVWGFETNGLKYSYNYDDSVLQEVNGLFSDDKGVHNPVDFFGKVEFNFYLDSGTIGWLTESQNSDTEVLRTVNIEKNIQQEITFHIPKNLQDFQPIIISTDKLLYHNYVLNSNNSIDTLEFEKGISFPHFDRVYMRANSFMVDKYFNLQNPSRPDVNPIDYNKIDGNRMVTQKVTPPNVNIANYRVETNHESIWLMSHKISPEKFLLYDVISNKAYPFELDKSIFKLENLRLIELEPDPLYPHDVKFSYHTSMTENNIYIYVIKDGIKLYRVSNYRQIIN